MIDNLISTVKRRAIKIPKREIQKRKQWMRCEDSESVEEREQRRFYYWSRILLTELTMFTKV